VVQRGYSVPFILDFTQSALDDLAFCRAHDQTRILDQIAIQLTHQPTLETRKRKALEPNTLGDWELRIGAFRIFYDIDTVAATVKIKAIGEKKHNVLFIRGKEYPL
jgi:mRNA-degrading endonuclease RelE of RelBE toxin-antitoxin system